MKVAEFRDCAKASAKTYYQYLDKHGKGRSEIHVRTIRYVEPYFHLTLSTRLPAFLAGESPKSLAFLIDGKLYSGAAINPLEYDPESALLTLDPQEDRPRNLLFSVSAEKVSVVSDLKFLVKRVFDWYASHGEQIRLPQQGAFPAGTKFTCYGDPPTDEQKDAICGALTSPFSYIWGAPGTGKTRCVLANCVLNLLVHKPASQILLIAPTNNAVEQMLFGLLPILENSGFSSDAVLRLGIASPNFAAKYQASCETHNLQQRIRSTTTERDRLLKYCELLRFKTQLLEFKNRLPCFLTSLDDARQKKEALADTLSRLVSRETSLKTSQLLLENEIVQLQNDICARRAKIASFSGKLKKFFSPSSYKALQRQLDACYDALRSKDASVKGAQDELAALYRSIAECRDALAAADRAAWEIKSRMANAAPAYRPLTCAIEALSLSRFDESVNSLSQSVGAAGHMLDERRSRYAAYENVAIGEIRERIRLLTEQLENLQESAQSLYLNRRVVAATIDRYISMFPVSANSGFSPQHIFMDEAAYCSLIKAAPLLASHVPVTFLGDHMQLPPVCEMDDRFFLGDEDHRPVFLWAQSAIYLDSLFHKSLYDACDDYLSGSAPDYTDMVKYDLTLTHRFGRSIASVLAGSVYDGTFSSANTSGTSIAALDAPRSAAQSSEKRVSMSECAAIERYLRQYRPLDYAILTPYRNQVKELSKMLPIAARENRILTVHASQGREFDTLIYSVVDTSNMYFTDSSKSIGKRVTNTAVSRARKKLVIACDCQFWRGQEGQLIAALINAADETR